MSVASSLKKNIRESVEVVSSLLCLVLILSALGLLEKTASAGTRWTQTPSWATPVSDSSHSNSLNRKPSGPKEYIQDNITPFSPGSNNLSLEVGQVFLLGDLGSKYADSLGTRIHYTYGVSDVFGFDTSLGYSSHSDGDYSLATLTSGVRVNLSWYDKIVPYANFGLGFYRPSYQLSNTLSHSQLLFGLHLGPGITLELTKQLFFGASITFHDIFGNQKVLPNKSVLEVDGTFTSFYLQAGVTF